MLVVGDEGDVGGWGQGGIGIGSRVVILLVAEDGGAG